MMIVVELLTFQLKDKTPGGSNHGIRASKKKMVTGVVLHIKARESGPIALLLESRPKNLVDGAGYDPCNRNTSAKQIELQICHGCNRHTCGDNHQCNHLLPLCIEMNFVKRMNSARTMVGVTDVLAIW
jgi:hypothetical protein